MNKNLILTLAVGETYSKMAELTHPSIRAYAEKIGADFKCIKESNCSSPHWEKFNAIYDLLNQYERIAYIDTDIIIREDCPDIFNVIPKDRLGLFDEMPWTSQRNLSLIESCKEYGITLSKWNGKYYNTGVMIIPRQFKHLFKKPEKESFNFYEQGYFNAILAQFLDRSGNEFAVQDLPYKYNRMTCMDQFTGQDRHASFIIHYAGYPSLAFVIDLIQKDIRRWKLDSPKYDYSRHILINVQGGLGDQVCVEPVIRFMRNNIYKSEDINVVTHWPELFRHLNVNVYSHDNFRTKIDTPYYQVLSLPGPETIMWSVISHLLCHTVDFSSMALLKRILPNKDKRIHLEVDQKDIDSVIKITQCELNNLVLVHPGRHWESKTFPEEYWQEIIDGLKEKGMKVCIIGQDEETRGTVGVIVREGMIDTRNLLSVNELIALISKAKLLITNDSAPLHIAGAFDNNLIVIPTCKHPDHLMPYRYGIQGFKAKALYKNLMCYDYVSQPTEVHGSSAHFLPGKWEDYLPDVDLVISESINLIKEA